MEISVIDDRVELAGVTLATIAKGLPASLEYRLTRFFQGRDEVDLYSNFTSEQELTEGAYEDGRQDGFESRQGEVERLERDLADIEDVLFHLADAVEDNDEPEIERWLHEAKRVLK